MTSASTSFLCHLGTPDELWKEAEQGLKPAVRPAVNSHVHLPPNFSAFETVAQVLELASAEDLRVLGASNYYDYSVYEPFAAEARARGIFPLFGIETIVNIDDLAAKGINVNDPGVPGKMYFCGKGLTQFASPPAEAAATLKKLREGDGERIAQQVRIIAEVFKEHGVDTGVTMASLVTMIAKRHGCPEQSVFPQERHVAQAFQEALFEIIPDAAARTSKLEEVLGATLSVAPEDTVGIQGALRTHLMKAGKPACVEASLIGFDEGYQMVLALGGIPCYPTLADGVSPISAYEEDPEAMIGDLQQRGVHALEFIPGRNDPDVLARYVKMARQAGMIVVAGTEHNTLDLDPLAPACRGGVSIADELQDIFWEGVCVVAGHQFLTAHGEVGYVRLDGLPCATFPDAEARIAGFRALGAAVMQRYWETL